MQTQPSPFVAVRARQIFGNFDPWCDVQLKDKRTPLPEPQDGSFPETPYTLSAKVGNVSAQRLWVTDSRLIFHGTLSGGEDLTTMDVHAGDHAGMAVAGHIRYEWITGVSYRLGTLPVNKEVEVRWFDEAGNAYKAVANFPKVIGSAKGFHLSTVDALAKEVLAKACRHRLSITDTKSEDALAFFQKHANSPEIPLNADPKGWNAIEIPCAYPAPGGREFSPAIAASPMPAAVQQPQAGGSQAVLELNELKQSRKKANTKAVLNILLGIGLLLLSVILFIAAEIGTGILFAILGVVDLLYGFTLKGKAKDWDARIQQMERQI